MGSDSIRYFLHINGRWRWRPSAEMKKHGFRLINMGNGGPELDANGRPAASLEDKTRALKLNQEWDAIRRGLPVTEPAACLAVIWDTQLSPIDGRTLKAGQRRKDRHGTYFVLDRTKTGRGAAGTVSRRTDRLLAAYLKALGVEMTDEAQLFRNRSGGLYTKSAFNDDFRDLRIELFGDEEKRQIQDFRRSGTVEAFAGGAEDEDVAEKLANDLDTNKELRRTYNPVNIVSVRRVDEARKIGRRKLREQKDSA